MHTTIQKRQLGPIETNPYGGGNNGYYSETAEIIKYAILVAIVVFFVVWVLGGLAHARRRIRQGRPLLAYHKWMWNMTHRSPASHYNHSQPVIRPGQNTYRMQDWSQEAPPPPAYNQQDVPPAYVPPQTDKSEYHNVYINSIGGEQIPTTQPGEPSIPRPQPAAAAPIATSRWH